MVTPTDTTAHDETCPLLSHSHLESQPPQQKSPTPLPVSRLASLCIARLVDPIAFAQLFPYVNEFMSDLHLTDDPSKIGLYSGLVESTFAVSQLLFIYQWAKLSDIIGRKPVLIAGMAGIGITTVQFGLSKSLSAALIARALGGMFSGNIAVIHSALGEITDSTNQALAVSIYGVMSPIGSIIGPLIGGSFSSPAIKYPSLFRHTFFQNHPYFLPCLISGSIAVLAASLSFVFLEETLPSKRKCNIEKRVKGTAENNTASVQQEPTWSVMELLALPVMSALVTSGFLLCFITTSFDVTFVLLCWTSVQSGGLNFSASQIGLSLATSGCIAALIQIFVMPHVLRKFVAAKLYVFAMSAWPLAYSMLALLNFIARGSVGEDGVRSASMTAMLWAGIAVILGTSRIGCTAYSLSMILIRENSPSPTCLARSNGVVQFAMCSARTFAPFLASSIFVFSINSKILGGYLWAVIMVLISLLGVMTSRRTSLVVIKTAL